MRITSITPYLIPEAVSSDDWSNGKVWVWLKVETDTRITGWGEAYVMHRREGSALAHIRDLSAFALGKNPLEIGRFVKDAYESFAEFQAGIEFCSALAAFEIALWDIAGKSLGCPAHQLFGGSARDKIPAYANCWSHAFRPLEVFIEHILAQIAIGFRAVKIYPFLNVPNLEEGLSRLRATREAIGKEIDILVDAWRVADPHAVSRIAQVMRDVNAYWFEDPIAPDNAKALADIRRVSRLTVVTGETLCRAAEYLPFFEERAVDIVNPDICCCGLSESRRIADLAALHHAKTALHNYNSMGVALAASLHVAAVIPNLVYLEYFQRFAAPSARLARVDTVFDGKGNFSVPQKPGLGVEVR